MFNFLFYFVTDMMMMCVFALVLSELRTTTTDDVSRTWADHQFCVLWCVPPELSAGVSILRLNSQDFFLGVNVSTLKRITKNKVDSAARPIQMHMVENKGTVGLFGWATNLPGRAKTRGLLYDAKCV